MESCEGALVTDRLFVGELRPSVEEGDLRGYFGQFGKVVRVELIRCRRTGEEVMAGLALLNGGGRSIFLPLSLFSGRKRGFGYVQFDDYDVVDKIICAGEHRILGRRCNVEKAVDKEAGHVLK